jgi:hypothetical protein
MISVDDPATVYTAVLVLVIVGAIAWRIFR